MEASYNLSNVKDIRYRKLYNGCVIGFDSNDNAVYMSNPEGFELFMQYDEQNRLVCASDNKSDVVYCKFYDDNGQDVVALGNAPYQY